MKDYTYYIPGYTGFCPDLPNHFGNSYGTATHRIILDRPTDLLEERLSDVRYGECNRGQYYAKQLGHHDHNKRKSCCRDCCYSFQKPDSKRQSFKEQRNRSGYMCPTYMYIEGYADIPVKQSYNKEPAHVHHPTYKRETCPQERYRVSKTEPTRHCGTIPNCRERIFTGMEFVLGETFGPSSRRLIRRHQDTTRGHARCC